MTHVDDLKPPSSGLRLGEVRERGDRIAAGGRTGPDQQPLGRPRRDLHAPDPGEERDRCLDLRALRPDQRDWLLEGHDPAGIDREVLCELNVQRADAVHLGEATARAQVDDPTPLASMSSTASALDASDSSVLGSGWPARLSGPM